MISSGGVPSPYLSYFTTANESNKSNEKLDWIYILNRDSRPLDYDEISSKVGELDSSDMAIEITMGVL